PVALDGAHLACGCTISTQRQSRNYVDLGGGTDSRSLAPPAAESTSTTMPLDKPPVCLECLLSGGSGGAPLLSRT
ncbi:PAAR domain-containing protein, partial [Xanthomonas oryzae pv. oryzae]